MFFSFTRLKSRIVLKVSESRSYTETMITTCSTQQERMHMRKTRSSEIKRKCGMCGKTTRLTKTECCDQWVCDDEHKYVMFSYATNSCHRNHRRYTLCGFHHTEQHEGDWQTCETCRNEIETEMYVWYGTNEYNFVKLQNPPEYVPTKCSRCGVVIRLGEDGHSISSGRKYFCERCTKENLGAKERRTRA